MEGYNTGRRPLTKKESPKEVDPKAKIDPEYFVRVSLFKYLAVVLGMAMLAFLCFHPSPENFLEQMGGPGERLYYLRVNYQKQMQIGFLVACLLHIGEALYAMKIASQLNLTKETIQKWAIQTFILGYASLFELTKYNEDVISGKRK